MGKNLRQRLRGNKRESLRSENVLNVHLNSLSFRSSIWRQSSTTAGHVSCSMFVSLSIFFTWFFNTTTRHLVKFNFFPVLRTRLNVGRSKLVAICHIMFHLNVILWATELNARVALAMVSILNSFFLHNLLRKLDQELIAKTWHLNSGNFLYFLLSLWRINSSSMTRVKKLKW